MITWLNKNQHLWLIDAILIIISAPLSFLIRVDASPLFLTYTPIIILFAAVGLIVKVSLYWAFGLYRHLWRYASTHELLLIVTAVTFSTLVMTVIFATILVPYGILWAFPRSVLIIDWLLQLVMVGGVRFLAKVSVDGVRRNELPRLEQRAKRVLIVGVNDVGAMIVREMQTNQKLEAIPIGFVDNDPTKVGKRVHNVPILGNLTEISWLIQKWYINEIIVTLPDQSQESIEEIYRLSQDADIPFKIISSIQELIEGQIGSNFIQKSKK